MRNAFIPHQPVRGLIARLAIQCVCPDTGVKGSFLYSGESPHARRSRVTPVYDGLLELFASVGENFEWVVPGNSAYGFIKK